MQVLIFCELGLKTPIHAQKMFLGEQNRGRCGAMLTPNELVLTFRGCYLCATFGENRSRNATVKVRTNRQTDGRTYWQRWTHLSHMLYAIAMGQVIINIHAIFSTSKLLKRKFSALRYITSTFLSKRRNWTMSSKTSGVLRILLQNQIHMRLSRGSMLK